MASKLHSKTPADTGHPFARAARPANRRLLYFGIFAATVALIFVYPLIALLRFALISDRNTYLLLVPVISGYLIWSRRKDIDAGFETSLQFASVPALLGLTALGVIFLGDAAWTTDPTTRLSLKIFSFICFLLAGASAFVGTAILRQIAFPLAFVFFIVPMPAQIVDWIEAVLQYSSAEAAYWMLSMTSVPFLRHGLDFQLATILLKVAPECSGYNSSFVLFLIAILASHLFLDARRNKLLLLAAVLPLAIVRNGLRITTVSFLCAKFGPHMIDSFIHRHGGPIFFVLSLVPFSVLLWGLNKSEKSTRRQSKIVSHAH